MIIDHPQEDVKPRSALPRVGDTWGRNQLCGDLLTCSRLPSGYSLNTTPPTITAFGNPSCARVAATSFKRMVNRRLNSGEAVNSINDFVMLRILIEKLKLSD